LNRRAIAELLAAMLSAATNATRLRETGDLELQIKMVGGTQPPVQLWTRRFQIDIASTLNSLTPTASF
jgi:hypothetical protein